MGQYPENQFVAVLFHGFIPSCFDTFLNQNIRNNAGKRRDGRGIQSAVSV